MDILPNGESSRSPRLAATAAPNGHSVKGKGRLILPQWDVPPPKLLRASHDLVSLLHLEPLYEQYVRPYETTADGERGSDDEAVPLQKKKRRLNKGYYELIDDCIDPTPLGENRRNEGNANILPLIPDLLGPALPPMDLYEGSIDSLPPELFNVARLEEGFKMQGYANGEKVGAKEQLERRRRKWARLSLPADGSNSIRDSSVAPPTFLRTPSFPTSASPHPSSHPGPGMSPAYVPRSSFARGRGGPPSGGRGGFQRGGSGPPPGSASAYGSRPGSAGGGPPPSFGGAHKRQASTEAGGEGKRVRMSPVPLSGQGHGHGHQPSLSGHGAAARSMSPALRGGAAGRGGSNVRGGRSQTDFR